MSPSEPNRTFRLHLRVAPNVSIAVFDGRSNALHAGNGPVSLHLPRGLYQVTARTVAGLRASVVRLDQDVSYAVPLPPWYSAIPTVTADEGIGLAGARQRAVERLTANWTTVAPTTVARAGFGLVVSAMGERSKTEPRALGRGLALYRADGTQVTDFDFGGKADGDGEVFVWSAPLEPGSYRLRFQGDLKRAIPIHLCAGWTTQAFVIHRDRPRVRGLRMLMSRIGQPFHRGRMEDTLIEGAMVSLEAGENLLPAEAVSGLLGGKFEDPMLGILGAYVALLDDPEPAPDRFSIILRNLMTLVPDHPDLPVLRLMAHQMGGEVSRLPTIRFGLEWLIRQSRLTPTVLAPDNEIDDMAIDRLNDLPWTSYRTEEPAPTLLMMQYLSAVVSDERSIDWVKGAIADAFVTAITEKRLPDISELAELLNVTPGVIKAALRNLAPRDEERWEIENSFIGNLVLGTIRHKWDEMSPAWLSWKDVEPSIILAMAKAKDAFEAEFTETPDVAPESSPGSEGPTM